MTRKEFFKARIIKFYHKREKVYMVYIRSGHTYTLACTNHWIPEVERRFTIINNKLNLSSGVYHIKELLEMWNNTYIITEISPAELQLAKLECL